MSDWRDQEVLNEVEARTRNEWIESTNDSFGTARALDDYACECSFPHCSISIAMTRLEYESVRRDGTHFAIALNHENPEIDQVVAENDRFAIVEKWFPSSRRLVLEADPRQVVFADRRNPQPEGRS
jgi:hypothetical protein